MRFSCFEYSVEIVEFLNEKTLEKIDYGILDLSNVRDRQLREVLQVFEELLRLELKVNYLENTTGVFRVEVIEDRYYYREFDDVLEARSMEELRDMVLAENRIWYVFDEVLACEVCGDNY